MQRIIPVLIYVIIVGANNTALWINPKVQEEIKIYNNICRILFLLNNSLKVYLKTNSSSIGAIMHCTKRTGRKKALEKSLPIWLAGS